MMNKNKIEKTIKDLILEFEYKLSKIESDIKSEYLTQRILFEERTTKQNYKEFINQLQDILYLIKEE
jgi:hypothetical protein